MEKTSETKALFLIINAGFSADAIEIARGAGAKGATIMNARGEGMYNKSFMGITVDSEREIVLFLVDAQDVDAIIMAVQQKAGRGTPANGICFTLPVEKSTVFNNYEA